VTSKEAGLAVVDWPNSYRYNMFLYPFSRMTGGVYYEHAHRLFGALVGLATLVVAVYLQRVETRAFVRRLAWLAVVMVVVQGLLGGLRVTGSLTLSTSPEDMAPSLTLAVIHGVFGQVFFATLVALAAITSAEWRNGPAPRERRGARTDHILGWVLVVMLIAQLVLGAVQRHTSNLLAVHIVMAGLVAPLALHLGMRAWGLNPDDRQLTRWGIALSATTGVQLTLGMGAFIAIGALEAGTISSTADVTLTTAHQWCGAILLACAVLVMCWNRRRLAAPD
jgi:cytochrome c oxidase assembly protein subunit 15